MRSAPTRSICALTVTLGLTACSASMPRSPAANSSQQHLIAALCPPRTPATDSSLAGWERKAYELAEQYDKCRAAAVGAR